MRLLRFTLSVVSCALIGFGCATSNKATPPSLQTSQSPVWSAKAIPSDMIVAVSPAGKTLRVAGSTGIVLGASADAIINARFRKPIHDSLEGYDAAEVFAGIIESSLGDAIGEKLTRVTPLGSTAGMNSRQEAQEGRYAGLAKKGHDLALDVTMTFGIYGSEGTLATKLDGKLVQLPETKTLWDNVIVSTTEPVFANTKLGDPTKRMGVNIANPDFTVDDEKVERWTADGGALLKQRFEDAARAVTSAMLCDLGVLEDASGEYTLGVLSMNRKQFAEASRHFEKALQLDPSLVPAANAHAVNLAHNGQVDDAIARMRSLTEAAPDYGPAWFNLAWWYAVKKKDAGSARPFYEKALALGVPSDKKIEKLISK